MLIFKHLCGNKKPFTLHTALLHFFKAVLLMLSHNINIEYKFESSLGRLGANRHVNSYKLEVYNDDHSQEPVKHDLIGKAEVSLVLLNLMLNQGIPYYTVFDESQLLSELGEIIIDFKTNEYKEPLVDEIMPQSGNLLVIDRLELLPKWRKKGIGNRIIKDIILRFSGCCDLVILKAFPLQQEYQYADKDQNEWEKKMQMHNLPKDEAFSNYKVYAYYQKSGFTQLEDTDYFYLNPAVKNAVFDAIDMEE
jgi:GNAT superfamily N-acetyltransferase